MESYKDLFFKLSFLFVLSSCTLIYGQESNSSVDSLSNKTYSDLFQDLNASKTLDQKDFYAKFIIKKAKKEKNKELLIAGYHTQAIIHGDITMIKYCDSIIQLTESKSNKTYPVQAYQLKGDYYFNIRDYNKALDNYLKVSSYANKYDNKRLIFKSNDNISSIKRRIGEKESALKLSKENYYYAKEYLKEIDTTSYLNAITSLANIYNDLKLPDSSSHYNHIGFYESNRMKKEWFAHHFSLNEGVSLFYNKNYVIAIDSLEKHIPYFEKRKDKVNLSLAYYYCGKSYEKIDMTENSIIYYKKVDTIFQKINSIYPNARNSYVQLIEHYKAKEDLKNQLLYINQLIKVDSIFHSEEVYLNKGVLKEYDIPKLKSEKRVILDKIKRDKSKFTLIIILISIILIILLFLIAYQNSLKKKYKKKFEDIINKRDNISIKNKVQKEIDISDDIIKDILNKLNIFENNKRFLSKKTTLRSLAKDFNTNTNYLSKIINHNKNSSFSNYINSLRIEHIIEILKTNSSIRKYTIKAIADEAGFSNSESFSKAFYKSKGIKPSYFIREMDKIKGNN
ncbi:helix-turn-helix domain-containing protein [Winogradskyella sp. R77965]|uniref:helix-turn-helix domain-containing protein n=1 Tax=Winogradskyella sp. R77965 TaxID=3093872 RepID=UPI0037DC69CF